MRSIKSISIIGSGNVATHLAKGLSKLNLNIDCIYSRKLSRAKKLAKEVNAAHTSSLNKINKLSDFYLIAVSDDAIPSVAKKLEKYISEKSIIAHTSGSVSAKVFSHPLSGVFYPLQSFTLDRKLELKNIPFCIHSQQQKIQKLLVSLAKKLSRDVRLINDMERKQLHLAAVISNNFSNHMYHIAYEVCERHNLEFNILLPLLNESIEKLKESRPLEIQTGPARRADQSTIKEHLKMLSGQKASSKIYKLITQSILKTYHN